MSEQDPKTAAQQAIDPTWPKAGECYRHYKGGLYDVLGVAIHEDLLAPYVVYRSRERGTLWLRTPANWMGEVLQEDGTWVPRFTLLGRTSMAARPQRIDLCEHDWQGLQTIPGSGRKCRKCDLVECD